MVFNFPLARAIVLLTIDWLEFQIKSGPCVSSRKTYTTAGQFKSATPSSRLYLAQLPGCASSKVRPKVL
jgi:hypothetical protein